MARLFLKVSLSQVRRGHMRLEKMLNKCTSLEDLDKVIPFAEVIMKQYSVIGNIDFMSVRFLISRHMCRLSTQEILKVL